MNEPHKPPIYRHVIEQLVRVCREGQGQMGARRVRNGIWIQNASANTLPKQHEINLLLKRLSPEDQAIIARLPADQVVTGGFETLTTA
jgi:hypothetical protein